MVRIGKRDRRESPTPHDPAKPSQTVVGIGASAGALAALKGFFAHVPPDSGLAFVVHLSPDQKSHLAELLQPHIGMPVHQVNESVPLEPDRVYLIPPNANLESVDTHLRLAKLEERRHGRALRDPQRPRVAAHGGDPQGHGGQRPGHDGASDRSAGSPDRRPPRREPDQPRGDRAAPQHRRPRPDRPARRRHREAAVGHRPQPGGVRASRADLGERRSAARVAQIIGNLLDNACKFTRPGDSIRVAADQQGADAMVTVADSGIGILPAKLAWIFEMFAQIEPAGQGSQPGLGLGLTLVKRLVEMHGGTVQARSDGPGSGSTFTVRLPLAPAPILPGAKKSEKGGADQLHGERILVVDDNRDAARSLALVFEGGSNEVRVAHDGAQALEVAEEFRPAVVVLDIGLPMLDGHEVARRLRARPWANGVVLVAVTGWGRAADEQLSAAAGFDAHVVKPVEPAELTKLVAQLRSAGSAEAPEPQ